MYANTVPHWNRWRTGPCAVPFRSHRLGLLPQRTHLSLERRPLVHVLLPRHAVAPTRRKRAAVTVLLGVQVLLPLMFTMFTMFTMFITTFNDSSFLFLFHCHLLLMLLLSPLLSPPPRLPLSELGAKFEFHAHQPLLCEL